MNYYCDISLLPDAESNLGYLWEKVYAQVHLALVENQKTSVSKVALSIPGYGNKPFPLGNKLRLLASNESELEQLKLSKWLNRLQDYCHITSVKPVPHTEGFVNFSRRQFKMNPERLARRRAKRHNESFEQALEYFKGMDEQVTKLPFIQVKSLSNNTHFPLFIEKTSQTQMVDGEFNCYGLSKTATVPWF
tara:strand:+ start:7698 stop:8270 length:573 start_codon:yes stop_codon:yes gene_type:complete